VTRGLSRYLDALRVFAAFVVFASHFAYERISGGAHLWIRELNLGSDAVVLFFVLSGFIIDFAAETKDRFLGAFAFSRATRVYSVAVPALLVTFLLDYAGSHLRPSDYAGFWYEGDRWPLRALSALTFTNELWFVHLRPGTNGPYWSLTYEVWYYAIFAALRFGGRGPLLAALLVLIAGPKPLLLAPAFALGVWVRRKTLRQTTSSPLTIALLVFGTPLLYALFLALKAPLDLRAATVELLGPAAAAKLGFSDEFLWNDLIAGLVAMHLLGVHAWLTRAGAGNRIDAFAAGKSGALVHWFAGGTFSLYLVHYPALQFLASVLPGVPSDGWRQLALVTVVPAFCFAFAALFERTLPELRAALRKRAWGSVRDTPPSS
jgi:peptidoglycan/LPS O-acetylase OafA/YrhL